jgi:hypothetical protein
VAYVTRHIAELITQRTLESVAEAKMAKAEERSKVAVGFSMARVDVIRLHDDVGVES